jgi:hypothetical protein
VVRSLSSRDYLPSGVIIDGSLTRDIGSSPTSVLRAGLLLGKVTTGGKYRNSIIGLTNGAISPVRRRPSPWPRRSRPKWRGCSSWPAGNINLRIFGPPSAAGTNAATTITVTAASGTTLTITSPRCPRTWTSRSSSRRTAPASADAHRIARRHRRDRDGRDDERRSDARPLARRCRRVLESGHRRRTDITALDASLLTWVKQQLNGGGTGTRGRWTFSDEVP